jgi:hypothetical protein
VIRPTCRENPDAGAKTRSARAGRTVFVHYTIEKLAEYIKAEMVERETAAETAEFVEALVAALHGSPLKKVLISIRKSRPVFKVEEWRLSVALDRVMSVEGLKVAFVSDTRELAMSQQYIALLGRQRGLRFEAFTSEPVALAWLQSE